MNSQRIHQLLAQVQRGELSPAEAARQLKHLSFESLGTLKIDHHRALRTGQPETIYAPGKRADEIQAALEAIIASGSDALVTRLAEETAAVLQQRLPELVYHSRARCAVAYVRTDRRPQVEPRGRVSVLCAGVSDLPVAEEARLTAELMGATAELISDVGVAGIHRLQAAQPALEHSDCLVVVAGMEGALASVVGGLTDRPVIAVPTSVGYGAAFDGLAALLGMLNSCASGVAVVNIDNGFGAGALAARIARQSQRDVSVEPERAKTAEFSE